MIITKFYSLYLIDGDEIKVYYICIPKKKF